MNTAALVVRLRPCRFPYAFPDERVRLAGQVHSLVRFSKRTTEHRLPDLPTGDSRLGRFGTDLSCPVALSPPDFKPYCTSLLGVLFSVPSRYLFAIGLRTYLVLTDDVCRIREEFPIPATLDLTHGVLCPDTGLSPCITLRSRRLLETGRPMRVSPNTTLPGRDLSVPPRLRFGLRRVHSRLLTTSRSLSLPAPTKMFQSGAFPIAQGNCGGDSHSEILSSWPPCGSLRLIAAWHVLSRRLSRAIHQMAQ